MRRATRRMSLLRRLPRWITREDEGESCSGFKEKQGFGPGLVSCVCILVQM